MGMPGRKPKPRDQIRHRVKPVHDWTEYPDVPFEDGPKLPATPKRPRTPKPPEPPRPLGEAGRNLWVRAWGLSTVPPDEDFLLQLCEQMDERVALRVHVFREGDWRDRNQLREVDKQVTQGLHKLATHYATERPVAWPAPTKRWWRAISRLPHAASWTEADWQFALDTAYLVAQFHLGDVSLAGEVRRRENVLGTTADARRNLRIRYVPLEEPDDFATNPSVTAMAAYRSSVQA